MHNAETNTYSIYAKDQEGKWVIKQISEEEYNTEMEKAFQERKNAWLAEVDAIAERCEINREQALAVLKEIPAFKDLLVRWAEANQFLYGR